MLYLEDQRVDAHCVERDRGPSTMVTAFLNLLWCKLHYKNVESYSIYDNFKQEYWCKQ